MTDANKRLDDLEKLIQRLEEKTPKNNNL